MPPLRCSVPNLQSDGEELAVVLNSSFKLAKLVVCTAEVAICYSLPCSITAALTLMCINQSALAFLLVMVQLRFRGLLLLHLSALVLVLLPVSLLACTRATWTKRMRE